MSIQSQESNEGRDGLFFCQKIETITKLEIAELTLWMGRGACFGWTLEQRQSAQEHLVEVRARLMGDVALG